MMHNCVRGVIQGEIECQTKSSENAHFHLWCCATLVGKYSFNLNSKKGQDSDS
jgi:hypothetical protein